MTLFKQITFSDGFMPSTHIAEVSAVSFIDNKMCIKLISKFPAINIPQEIGSKEAIAYYHPGVPYYYPVDPDEKRFIPCEFISARYFMVGEKVSVIQNGQTYFVVSSIYPILGKSHRNFIGPDIEDSEWLSQLDGAVSWKIGNGIGGQLERKFYLANNDVVQYEFITDESYIEAYTGYYGSFYPCFHLWWQIDNNISYPVAVGLNPSIIHLNTWTWGRGDYNYMHTNVPRERSLDETIENPSFLFPTLEPSIRLEIQAASEAPDYYSITGLPNVEFYITGSDIGYGLSSDQRDFIGLDNYVNLVVSRARPWGVQPTNTQKWETLNWTPNILVYPIINSGNYILTYGFIDYVKDNYDGFNREVKGNILHLVTGEISVSLNPEFPGKEPLASSDFSVSHVENYEELTSIYKLQIINTGTGNEPVFPNENVVTQTVSINTELEEGILPDQYFTICSDGTNIFKKFPIVTQSETRTYTYSPSAVNTVKTLTVEVKHFINSTKIYTNTFDFDYSLADPTKQKLYYLFHVDIPNKLFIADIYSYDHTDSDAQSITRVAIDGNTQSEYIIWTYTPFTPNIPTPRNVPPWDLDEDFPEFPYDDFDGTESSIYEEKIWRTPFFAGLNFPVNTTPDSQCSINSTSYAFVTGVNYPLSLLDEDIHSILLLATIHYETEIPGYTQAKEHVYIKPRRNGWIAYGQCCLDPDSGVIDYPYGTDVLKNINGSVTGADELYTTTPRTINVF